MKNNHLVRAMFCRLVPAILLVLAAGCDSSDQPEHRTDLSTLKSLPYVDYVDESAERKKKTGVELYLDKLCYPGYNFYCNHYEDTTGVYLMDMAGHIVHRWTPPEKGAIKFVAIDGDGSIVGSFFGAGKKALIKLDWNSELKFSIDGEFHHDARILPDGRIVTLRRERNPVTHNGRQITVAMDYLVILAGDGRRLGEYSLFEALREHPLVVDILDQAARRRSRNVLDLLHTNTTSVLTGDVAGVGEAGDILMCMRNLDLILVFDYRAEKIKWQYFGREIWEHPHEPTMLPNGRILIFDNGYKRGYSRVLEIDPATREIKWEYKGDPPASFFTKERGSIQRFPGGNTLITESDTGRAFEITPAGEIVWEWFNPMFSADQKRAIVYRMKRLEPEFVHGMVEANQ